LATNKVTTTQSEKVSFKVAREEVGQRLDQLLPARVPGLSRRRARVLIDLGGVFIDRRRVKIAARPLKEGEEVVAHLGGALLRASGTGQAARAAEDRRLPPFSIVYEDEHLFVVDKPAGLLTAPTPESDRGNLMALLERQGGQRQPVHLVHRLDMPTSGLLIFARTQEALLVLAERFRTHDLDREYLAVVAGAFPDKISLIDQPIERRPCRTHVKVLERFGVRATLLGCKLETGRTHQIRIHCRALGHWVMGDRQYGQPSAIDPPRMALHATRLALPHPITGAPLEWQSPWPADLTPWLDSLRANSGKPVGSPASGLLLK
jgi:23S rRNA pseudouridine1911/1915/1917 synthase